jgi:hypothetical protein
MRTTRLLAREGALTGWIAEVGVNPCDTEVLKRLFASGIREEKVSVESLWPNKGFLAS